MTDNNVYEGSDRIRQICYLQDLATNIAFGSDDPDAPARDRVNYYCANFPEELPGWFDDGDKQFLIDYIEAEDEEGDEEWPEACHDGSDWRTRWDGYPRHEHPSHDPPAYASGGW